MRNLTCIVCPIGCSLTIEEETGEAGEPAPAISGNRCKRGAAYALEEIRAPKRVVTATCAVDGGRAGPRRAPVKTTLPCPKELIPVLLADIYRLRLTLPIREGDRVMADWQDSGIDVIALRDLH
jgi:CxxC motif-containing protein